MPLRRRRRATAVAEVQPDPLRSAADATETGLLWGVLGAPWAAITAKNLKDRRIATGDRPDDDTDPRRSGTTRGRRAGTPPRGSG